ncbi:MAG: hypothetical protein Q4C98_06820 [Capnocytophaga sp.]|nr:hypothetical protein [Capnocytophaga sp.]
MSNINELVELLEEKATSLRKKIDDLNAENQRLVQLIETLTNDKKELEYQIECWKEKNDAIKIANSILGGNENKTEAKLKINALIREIDACIIQLSK